MRRILVDTHALLWWLYDDPALASLPLITGDPRFAAYVVEVRWD